jgi:threo-3-hydroxy-L-aspartate ammonia-lyase
VDQLAVTRDDVQAARARISEMVRQTPIVPLDGLGRLLAKCETFQRTGAFKARGASNALLALRPKGVITASSGNHGQAVAWAARLLDIPAVVVMPEGSTEHKRAAVRAMGARIVDAPRATTERNRVAAAIAEEEGLAYVPPYDHPLVIAGQGTCGLEIADDVPDVARVIVPLGGGGLLSGIAVALRGFAGTAVHLVGVEPEDGDDFVRSLEAGHPVEVPPPATICDGARTQSPGELTFPIVNELVDEVVTVSDAEVVDAVRRLAGCGLVVEPTGALGVAAALRLGLDRAPGPTVCVLTGRNISPAVHARLVDDSA